MNTISINVYNFVVAYAKYNVVFHDSITIIAVSKLVITINGANFEESVVEEKHVQSRYQSWSMRDLRD